MWSSLIHVTHISSLHIFHFYHSYANMARSFFFRENSLCLLYRSTLSLLMCFTGINLMVSHLNLCSCMELQLELIFAPGHVEVSQVHSTTSALSVTQHVRVYRPGSICRVVPLHWGTFRR